MVNNRTIIAELYKKQGDILLDLGQMLAASKDWYERNKLLETINIGIDAQEALVKLAIAYEGHAFG